MKKNSDPSQNVKNLEDFFMLLRDSPSAFSHTEPSGLPLLHSIHIVGFHHKQGSILEFSYPVSYKADLLAYLALPDCVHNTNTETFYFTLVIEESLKHCISCFCQVPNLNITEEMNRNFVQKAVVIVSNFPYYGIIAGELQKLTKVYFEQEDFGNTQILIDGFLGLQNRLTDLKLDDLYLGFNTRMLIKCFKEKIMNIFKLLMLQGRIIVFSKKPSLVSAFIYALLSLFPGQLNFGRFDFCTEYLKHLEQYGLPFQFLSDNFTFHSYFSIFQLAELEKPGYLIGCTNQMIVEHPRSSPHATVFIDNLKIKFHLPSKLKDCIELSSSESKFIKDLSKNIESSWTANENWFCSDSSQCSHSFVISEFHRFIKSYLANLALLRQKLQGNKIQTILKVPKESASYEYNKMNPKVKKTRKFKKFLKGGFKNKFIVHWANHKSFESWLVNHPNTAACLSQYCGEVHQTEVRYETGEIYRGSLSQGRRHGKGMILTHTYKYEGEWDCDKKHGKGTLTSELEKYVYDGMWKNDLKDGSACEIKGECKYNGVFQDGKYNGYGIIIYTDQSQYEGEWVDGKKQGMGHWSSGKGDSFRGEFVDDKFCGQGQFTFASGDIFVGKFKDGEMVGVGEFLFLNGEVYKGEVLKDKPHGKGVLQKKSGIKVEGIFEMGEVNRSDTVVYYEDGREYQGSVDEKFRPHGRGVMHFPTQNIIPAVWVHGIQEN